MYKYFDLNIARKKVTLKGDQRLSRNYIGMRGTSLLLIVETSCGVLISTYRVPTEKNEDDSNHIMS